MHQLSKKYRLNELQMNTNSLYNNSLMNAVLQLPDFKVIKNKRNYKQKSNNFSHLLSDKKYNANINRYRFCGKPI